MKRFFAYLILLGWHGLAIIAYLDLLDRQSGLRVSYDGYSEREEMLIFGVYIGAPVLVGTLLVGVILLRRLLVRSRVRSAVLLGTAAALPMLLFVAVAAGFVLR